jgi:hypothetical protein
MYDFVRTTVMASWQTFEEHPESYRPRVFVESRNRNYETREAKETEYYELLQNGQAIQWPSLPPKDCPFDYWSSVVISMRRVTMVRSNIPASRLPWDVAKASYVAKPDVTAYEKVYGIDHLPEGSH